MSENEIDNDNYIKIRGFKEAIDADLHITLKKIAHIPKCVVVGIKGYVTGYNEMGFQRQIARLIKSGYINLVFDCNDMGMKSENVIVCFAGFLKSIRPHGGNMAILNLRPNVEELFCLLGFGGYFYIVNNMKDALMLFRQNN